VPAWLYCDALVAHLDRLGPVHLDTVVVGVFVKSDRKLAEIRPRARALHLALCLPRALDHPRVARVLAVSPDRCFNVVKLTSPSEVDDELRRWLTEAYDYATD
jgi:hypothetical protein